jgi:tripartite-type tricarboxylate transporter receptor subunit TctC
MKMLCKFKVSIAFLILLGFANTIYAQTSAGYPDKPVRIIVPYPPGGFNDTMARIFARKLQTSLGQTFIVDNKPGGGTILGTDIGAKASPDGYTLLVAGFPLVVNQYLSNKLPYDSKKDFSPIILGGQTPNLLLVPIASPIKSLADLVAAAKANPGKLNYGSSGNGTSQHLSMEYFKSVTGTELNQIPYKGSAPMVADLLGGQLDVMFDNLPNALPHVKAGKMRALGVTSAHRLSSAPSIPTLAEQGYPGFEVSVWYGLVAPANVPTPILVKINAELNKALKSEEVKENFAAQGVSILGGSITDFNKFFLAQDVKWSEVISKAGIKSD